MALIVRKIDGAWQRWQGANTSFERTVSTFNAQFADGRIVEMPCEPYTAPAVLSSDAVERAVDEGTWTNVDLDSYGLKAAQPFVAPDGKQATGEATYVEDGDAVKQVFVVEDIPAPPPPPTPLEKLSSAGLTLDDLRELLAQPQA